MIKIIKMALGGTTAMTLFSYLLSVTKKEKFLEPLILNQLIYSDKKSNNSHHVMGYIIHYLVGQLFSFFYFFGFKKSKGEHFYLKALLAGIINGMIGVLGWHVTLISHKNPPKIKLKSYFFQLIIAHGIFGIFNALIYKSNKKEQ